MLEEENNQPKEEQAQEAAPAAPVKEAEAAFHSIQAMTPWRIWLKSRTLNVRVRILPTLER
jgi:hypothetical protein